MEKLNMPDKRDYGWKLKETSSTHFAIQEKENGQFCVVLNHSLLRGVTAEMLLWWFQNFAFMKVTLDDIEGYENKSVPTYLLWHPSDHRNAEVKANSEPYDKAKAGDIIHIQEAMQYLKYQWKYPVNKKLNVFYCDKDGWAMGLKIPVFGEAMILSIHFQDVIENNEIIGAHYHYEVVMGVNGNNILSKTLNKLITRELNTDFFSAWHLHNTIEVGTFENFLPALYAQRHEGNFHYSKAMNPTFSDDKEQKGYSEKLFKERVEGYKNTNNPFDYQGYTKKNFFK